MNINLGFLRPLWCRVKGHDEIMLSPDSLATTIICLRCSVSTEYHFVVEDGFFEREFPETY